MATGTQSHKRSNTPLSGARQSNTEVNKLTNTYVSIDITNSEMNTPKESNELH